MDTRLSLHCSWMQTTLGLRVCLLNGSLMRVHEFMTEGIPLLLWNQKLRCGVRKIAMIHATLSIHTITSYFPTWTVKQPPHLRQCLQSTVSTNFSTTVIYALIISPSPIWSASLIISLIAVKFSRGFTVRALHYVIFTSSCYFPSPGSSALWHSNRPTQNTIKVHKNPLHLAQNSRDREVLSPDNETMTVQALKRARYVVRRRSHYQIHPALTSTQLPVQCLQLSCLLDSLQRLPEGQVPRLSHLRR